MKKFLLPVGSLCLSVLTVQAQQKQGVVVYERNTQVQIRFSDGHEGMEQQLPKTRTDQFELSFGNNQSLWKSAEEDNDNGTTEMRGGDGGGMQIRMVIAGNDDVLYNNFETGKKVEKRELFEKTFIIDDSIRSLKWKMTGETKTILNLPCMKATTIRTSTRSLMNMENGKMERKEIQDTSTIIAWFTSSIPVSAGPAEFQGQLPGLILEMDVKDGTQTFKATSVSEKVDLASIKEPTGKKHYTPDEFKKEREKMLEEMQRNNQGGQRIIRMN
ncbi:MAG: GLPGLI family protein [Bacteroidota bacterium]|nr:GLPGLI family protein [Bacteroidota bacterium]